MRSERALRVALLEPAGRGGIHQYARALAGALAADGAAVLLVTARDPEFAAADRLTPPPFAVVPLFDRWRSPPRALLAALRAFAPDVLHLQAGTHPLLHLGLLLAARAATGAPVVVTAHDVVPKNASRLGALAAGLLQRAADRIVVHGAALEKELASRVPSAAARIRVLPHGEFAPFAARDVGARMRDVADDDAPIDPAVTSPTLLFFGFLHEEKGLPDLIEALPRVAARVRNLLMVVAGKPEIDVAPLQRRARALGVADRIEWRLQYIEAAEVGALFAAATAVVLPYRNASQSGVVYLAGAYARPLVATRVGALPEVVADGVTGLLVPPRDPAALAAALTELLSDPARARKMGRAHARRCRTEGSWASIAQRTRALYRELATGREAGRGKEEGEVVATTTVAARERIARS
jgi:glycosyltransferase involved in cell wall biosynthesis